MSKSLQKPTILNVETVAQSRLFSVESVDLEFSNGVRRVYERMRPSTREAVMIVPIVDDHLILIREYAVGTESYELGFSKGLIDPGESVFEAANRELKEEVGFGANDLTFLKKLSMAPSYFSSKIETDQNGVIFEAKPKIACPECDIPVIYGDTQKSNVLENSNVEDVSISGEQQNAAVPMPKLEQANQALVAQTGAQEYAPHVINTPLAFLIKSALNTNIFGEPGWMGTGWRAGRDLNRHDIGGKTGTTNSSKDAWFSGYGPGVVTSVWIGFDDHRRDLGRTTASGAIKDQISGYEGGAKSAQPAWDAYMKVVLEGVPEEPLTPPPGIITVNIDRSTGQLANGGNSRAEYFIEGTQPTQQAVHEVGTTITDGGETHELF